MADLQVLNSYRLLYGVHHSRRFIVYQALKVDTDAEVLIKTPDPARSKDKALLGSLLKEAQTGISLSHPRIRAVYESREDGDSAFLIGEYIKGRALVNQLDDSPSLDTAITWITDILEALVYAHENGIYHLNLNPYNIIIDEELRAKIIGFGKEKTAYLNKEESFHVYQPILFVAPELYQAGITLPSSDLFSVAVLAYFIICGVPPWRIDLQLGFEQQKQQSLSRAVIMPERLNKEMPDWLLGILLQCLKLDPNQRLQSAKEMLNAIRSKGNSLVAESAEPDKPELIPEPVIAETPLPPVETIEIPPEEEPAEPEPIPVADIPPAEPEAELPVPELPVEEAPEIVPELKPENQPAEPVTEEVNSKSDDVAISFAELRESLETEQSQAPQEDILPDALLTYSIEDIPVAEPITPKAEIKPEPSPKEVLPQKPIVSSHPVAPPSPRPKMYDNYPPKQADTDVQETYKLKKTFIVMLWFSLAIMLFVVVKYFIFGNQHKFSTLAKEDKTEETVAEPEVENKALELVKVPGDTLVMGSIAPEAGDDEFPLLTIAMKTFYISPKEITQEEWQMVYPNNPSQFKDKDLPVENVSFYDVIDYCNAKSIKDGFRPCYDYYDTEVICNFESDGYRLPTEAEWEFAAKAGKHRDFNTFSGGSIADEVGWYNTNSNAHSHKVGEKAANQLGLYDLSGNLFEWVWNWYAPYTYRNDDLSKGPSNGTDKVIRGGSWYHSAPEMRVTNRNYAKPYTRSGYIGFRVVRSYND